MNSYRFDVFVVAIYHINAITPPLHKANQRRSYISLLQKLISYKEGCVAVALAYGITLTARTLDHTMQYTLATTCKSIGRGDNHSLDTDNDGEK